MPRKWKPKKDLVEFFYCDKKMTVAELAELFDAGETTVRGWMDELGIPRRPSSSVARDSRGFFVKETPSG